MKRIVLTGGGTAGHVTPNMALVPKLIDEGYNIYYIGSYEGMEKKLIEDIGVTYYGISSGKLRRYFDIKNFSDPFRVIKGFFKETSSRRCIFQRWLCHCACCDRCQTAPYSRDHS
jgi:UDP-N-acetylglucosamine--N-acetylmuramyl-(pentapeptide) pyrophosphoryl-undecaprenol N-acetylglucosamine transferase